MGSPSKYTKPPVSPPQVDAHGWRLRAWQVAFDVAVALKGQPEHQVLVEKAVKVVLDGLPLPAKESVTAPQPEDASSAPPPSLQAEPQGHAVTAAGMLRALVGVLSPLVAFAEAKAATEAVEDETIYLEARCADGSVATWRGEDMKALLALLQPEAEPAATVLPRAPAHPQELDEALWEDAELTVGALALVDRVAGVRQVLQWTPEERTQASTWASAYYLAAGDNDVAVPPMPGYVKALPKLGARALCTRRYPYQPQAHARVGVISKEAAHPDVNLTPSAALSASNVQVAVIATCEWCGHTSERLAGVGQP